MEIGAQLMHSEPYGINQLTSDPSLDKLLDYHLLANPVIDEE
jgi:hypothetical protein